MQFVCKISLKIPDNCFSGNKSFKKSQNEALKSMFFFESVFEEHCLRTYHTIPNVV